MLTFNDESMWNWCVPRWTRRLFLYWKCLPHSEQRKNSRTADLPCTFRCVRRFDACLNTLPQSGHSCVGGAFVVVVVVAAVSSGNLTVAAVPNGVGSSMLASLLGWISGIMSVKLVGAEIERIEVKL